MQDLSCNWSVPVSPRLAAVFGCFARRTLAIGVALILGSLPVSAQSGSASPAKTSGVPHLTDDVLIEFLRWADIAADEVQRQYPLGREGKGPSFYANSYPVRALGVAYDLTGRARYREACERWCERMIEFQRQMIPAGAYYMNYKRKPGESTGEWFVADSAAIAMGVLSTALRCPDAAVKQRYMDSVSAFYRLVKTNWVMPSGGVANGHWAESDKEWWCSTALFGALAFQLYGITGDESYRQVGLDTMRWLPDNDYTQRDEFSFEAQPTIFIFYVLEGYGASLPYLPPGGDLAWKVARRFSQSAMWIVQNQDANGLWTLQKLRAKQYGMPYHLLVYARAVSDTARKQAEYISRTGELKPLEWLVSDATDRALHHMVHVAPRKEKVDSDVVFGMMSCAEKLCPGELWRKTANTFPYKRYNETEVAEIGRAHQARVEKEARDAADTARRVFDVPAGDAGKSLKVLSQQAGRGVIFSSEALQGLQTNAVRGEFTAREAIERMVKGTGLVLGGEEGTGAFAVRKEAADPNGPRAAAIATGCARPLLELQPSTPQGQGPATGRIVGRIFSPARSEYVRNAEITVAGLNLAAYSEGDGSYVLDNVAAGEVVLTVTYTGYDTATARLTVAPGQTVAQDFQLKGSIYRARRSADGPPEESMVVMDKFEVSSEREGNAKAIMEQRAALNMKNVVAGDNFGDITGGNPGEFLKYLPGVVIDYVGADARAVRLLGLDPTYTTVSVDGMRMASAASASFQSNTRQFEFEQASINNIESIEVNKTLTASMDADAPAGNINMRSKNAFERKGRVIDIQAGFSANQYELTLRRTPHPGDGQHRKVLPGVVFNYADSFRGRFGIQLSLSGSQLFSEAGILAHTFDTSNAARGPVINAIAFRDNPHITTRAAFGLNLDCRLAPGLVVALRTAGSHLDDEINSRGVTFTANTAQIDPSSTLTYLLAQPNTTTRLDANMGHSQKFNDTITYTPSLEFKRNSLVVSAGGGYSRSWTEYDERQSGYFTSLLNRLTRISWTARRDSPSSTEWMFSQVSGADWRDLANYNKVDTQTATALINERKGLSKVRQGNLDARQTFNLGLPITVHAGVKTRVTSYDLPMPTVSLGWLYVGPARSVTDRNTVMIAHPNPNVYDPKQGGNITTLGIPIANATAMYDLYSQHPEYFIFNEFSAYRALRINARSVKEQVDAGYVEFNTRWRRLRLNLGAREERTRTTSGMLDVIPDALVRAAGYTPNTIPYLDYQYRNFEQRRKYGRYENVFFSGGAKYAVTRNLSAQLAACQSIRRPSYNNIAGALTINAANLTVTMPNPDMKPETSDKYFASLQYALEPAGIVSVSAYQLEVENMGQNNAEVSAEEAGYADDPYYLGYTFYRPSNLDQRIKTRGVEFEYSQQLVFLPGWGRGFSVFGSVARAAPNTKVVGVVPKAASGGIRFSNHRFNLQLRSTWTAARLSNKTAAYEQWSKERTMFDLSGAYKFGPRCELTLSGRNILNAPERNYLNEPGMLLSNSLYGGVWTLGARFRF